MATFSSINVCPQQNFSSKHKFCPSSSTLHITSCSNPSTTLSPSAKTRAISEIQSSGIIACLRAPSTQLALGAARAALYGGISALEVVTSSPGVFEVISELVREFPNATIGVGTVLNVKDAKRAVEAGAKFLMSPATINDVFDEINGAEVLYIPGAMTPTEILSAHNVGAEMVKVYPVSALGGVNYIGALTKPFPHIPMIASQGITIDSIGAYIGRGACGVVLSDAIFNKKAMSEKDFKAISLLSSQAALLGSKAVIQLRSEQGG